MSSTRRLLTIALGAILMFVTAGCASLTSSPAATVTVQATPSAAPLVNGWVGEEPLGAGMDVVVFLSWTQSGDQLNGQMQAAYPGTAAQGVVAANGELSGTVQGSNVSIDVQSNDAFGWKGAATGTVNTTELNLEGIALTAFLPSDYGANAIPSLTFKAGTAQDFYDAVGQLQNNVQSRDQNEQNGCPAAGCG